MTFFQLVIKNTAKIPYGRVATYGQIAGICGSPRGARMVGWALRQISGDDLRLIPWYRVINREGRISIASLEHPAEEQASLLKKEGITVEYRHGNYFVDLKKYLWRT